MPAHIFDDRAADDRSETEAERDGRHREGHRFAATLDRNVTGDQVQRQGRDGASAGCLKNAHDDQHEEAVGEQAGNRPRLSDRMPMINSLRIGIKSDNRLYVMEAIANTIE